MAASATPNATETSNPSAVFTRRHDLDWLRIIAFGLLILYHIGMFFVPWDWHVKSQAANEAPQYAMLMLNPWRLALLFFISGVAIRYLSDKLGAGKFAGDRTLRLLPVIIFGMLVVVMPQTWAQLRQSGAIEDSLLAFWPRYIVEWRIAGIEVPTWNHLWYVVYLWVYCLLLAPLFPALRWLGDGPVGRLFAVFDRPGVRVAALLVLPILPFIAYRLWLDPHFPTTHNLTSDWANHAHRLTILLIGFWIAKAERFWTAVDKALPAALAVIVTYGIALAWALPRPEAAWEGQDVLLWTLRIGRILYAWCAILALLALARRFLTGDGPVRRYLTVAIFPYYILHQTLIVVTGYWIAPMGLGAWTEFAILVAVTLAGCAVCFEIARRVPGLRLVMGLKPQPPTSSPRPASAASVPPLQKL
ncbi:acyltransferase family protein [Maricaulis sp. CAU 1757]